MKLYSLIVGLAVLSGCSTAYILKPITTDSVSNENCTVKASLFEAAEETLFKISVENLSSAAFEINPTSFSIQSMTDVLGQSPVSAIEPQPYLKKLSASADLYEARANTTNWLGIDALTNTDEYKSIKSEHQTVEAERKNNFKMTEKIRLRISKINGRTLDQTTLETGKTIEGIVIFPTAIKNDGILTLNSQNPLCTVSLSFEAD
jgi:hypothetical protein